jgi:hypothetical protein
MLQILAITFVFASIFNFTTRFVSADGGQKIKLEVQFLEEGSGKVLSNPLQLEGDQGVFASISVPGELQGKYSIERQTFDDESLKKIGNNDFYSSKLVYQIFFKKAAAEEKIVQQGNYTLNIEEYDSNGKNWQINYPDTTDSTGKPIKQSKAQSTNFATTFGYYMIAEDKVLVWCFDPQLPANHMDKYEKRTIADNEMAALIQNFGVGYAGQDKNPLNASTEQKMLWELLNSKFPNNPYVIERDKDAEGHYSNDNLRQLTAEELAKINAFKVKIDEMIKLYKSENKPVYTVGGKTLENNTIVTSFSDKGYSYVIKGSDDYTRQLIKGFKNGTVKAKNGFTVNIVGDDTIEVKVSGDTKPGTYDIADFSLIRPEYTGESVEYYSNYGNQPLQVNRLSKPKTYNIKLTIKDGVVPNDPPVVEKPEYKEPIGTVPPEAPVHDKPEYNGGAVPLDPPVHDKPEYKEPIGTVPPEAPVHEKPEFNGGVVPNDPPVVEKPEAPVPSEPKPEPKVVIEFPKEKKQEQPKGQKVLPNTGSSVGVASIYGLGLVTIGLAGVLYRRKFTK